MGNRVEDLETQVAQLQAAVDGLTEELVETKERLRQLETATEIEPSTETDDAHAEFVANGADDTPDAEEAADDGSDGANSAETGDGSDDDENAGESDDIIVA